MTIIQSITDNHIGIVLIEDSICMGGLDADLFTELGWHLCRLNVKEKFRGHGHGRKMIEILKKNTNGLDIGVHPGGYDMSQEKIESFYLHMGFVKHEEGFIWRNDNG